MASQLTGLRTSTIFSVKSNQRPRISGSEKILTIASTWTWDADAVPQLSHSFLRTQNKIVAVFIWGVELCYLAGPWSVTRLPRVPFKDKVCATLLVSALSSDPAFPGTFHWAPRLGNTTDSHASNSVSTLLNTDIMGEGTDGFGE